MLVSLPSRKEQNTHILSWKEMLYRAFLSEFVWVKSWHLRPPPFQQNAMKSLMNNAWIQANEIFMPRQSPICRK